MKTIVAAGVAVALLAGTAAADTRSLSGFTGVSASDRIRVEVAIGESYSVQVTGSDAERVQTRVDDNTLTIRRSDRRFWGGTPPIDATVRVTMPAIANLSSSRGAELTARGIEATTLALAASMGGELSAEGTCGALDAAVSMGGTIRAQSLQCRDADISASMGGTADVFASDRYDVSASMGGTVDVSGGGRGGDIALSMGGTVDAN